MQLYSYAVIYEIFLPSAGIDLGTLAEIMSLVRPISLGIGGQAFQLLLGGVLSLLSLKSYGYQYQKHVHCIATTHSRTVHVIYTRYKDLKWRSRY